MAVNDSPEPQQTTGSNPVAAAKPAAKAPAKAPAKAAPAKKAAPKKR